MRVPFQIKGKIIEGPIKPDTVPVVIVQDPIAFQCSRCLVWSKYKDEYNFKMPRTWTDDNRGFTCGDCNKGKK